MHRLCVVVLLAMSKANCQAQDKLGGEAQRLYEQARTQGRAFAQAEKLQPEVWPTSDGRSFLVVYRASKAPTRWIASLHGAGKPARGFATDDLVAWSPHLRGRDVGIICLQWWKGTGDRTEDFLRPEEVYRELDVALARVKAKEGECLLHGFSRGSTNTFAVMALDHGRGKKYFSLAVAHSGGVALDYPPTRRLLAGDYGESPLKGTRWITVAGGKDPNAERDGIAGMRRTAQWLKEQGAEVKLSIEDTKYGHGALHLNPGNAKRVLDLFLNETKGK